MNNEIVSKKGWTRIIVALVSFFIILFLGMRFMGADDCTYVLMWWATLILLGIVMQPLAIVLFNRFFDGGWVFSKALGIAVCGWLLWFLSSMKLVKFTRLACFLIIAVCFLIGCVLFYYLVAKRNRKFRITSFYMRDRLAVMPFSRASSSKISCFYTRDRLTSILCSEVVFLGLFMFWCYLKGNNPAAFGTERYMDYGYMLSMFKSEYMPPSDMWFAGEGINYYYLGQYLCTFISKTSGVPVTHGYNIAMMMLAAFGFSMPYSIVANLLRYRLKSRKKEILPDEEMNAAYLGESLSNKEPFFRPMLGGVLAGLAVSFSSTMHYPVYKFFVPRIQKILGKEKIYQYWFADATRYIGHLDDRPDKTIHEFPVYSYVLGDLHAHVINTIFVMTVLAVLLAWLLERMGENGKVKAGATASCAEQKASFAGDEETVGIGQYLKARWSTICKEAFHPAVLVCSFLIGMFHMTNFWDFPIYFVVSGAIILFTNLIVYHFDVRAWIVTAGQAVVFLVVGALVSLPFTLTFDSISKGIGITGKHTLPHEFLVVWGLPFLCLVVFFSSLLMERYIHRNKYEHKKWLPDFFESMHVSDLFVLTTMLCAAGLVLLPEIIYVVDIYQGAYERANTMFKLTYQAFIMFGIGMAYVICRFVSMPRNRFQKAFGIFGIALIIMCACYFDECYRVWFGNAGNYTTLDASAFIKDHNADDAEMIDYINTNIEGQPVIAEMGGLSYTYFNRISVFTGDPTVIGWQTHEWLWRCSGNFDCPQSVIDRKEDIRKLYSSQNPTEILTIIDKYNIDYIYYGACERVFGYEQITPGEDTDYSNLRRIENEYYTKLESNLNVLLSIGTVEKCIPSNDSKTYATYLIKVKR